MNQFIIKNETLSTYTAKHNNLYCDSRDYPVRRAEISDVEIGHPVSYRGDYFGLDVARAPYRRRGPDTKRGERRYKSGGHCGLVKRQYIYHSPGGGAESRYFSYEGGREFFTGRADGLQECNWANGYVGQRQSGPHPVYGIYISLGGKFKEVLNL